MRRLTFRRLAALVRHMPPDSPVAIALGQSGWTVTDYLLSDVFHATAGKAHPNRPKPSKVAAGNPDKARRMRSARRRAAARKAAIARGDIR